MFSSDNNYHVQNLTCLRQQKNIFAPVSFNLCAGEVLIVEGENGSGKSSLLRILCGLATPNTGKITWQDQNVDATFLQQIHYISHDSGNKLGLTIMENLLLQMNLHQVSSRSKQRIHSLQIQHFLSILNLEKEQNQLVMQLSAGQKRRLALARLLLIPKKFWILDEPLTALDRTTQELFIKYLKLHLQEGGLAIISTHQPLQLGNYPIKKLSMVAC